MVKKKVKKQNSLSAFGKQLPSWVFVVVLFGVVIAGFIGYNAYLNYQDKQKFTRLEKTVDTLVDRLGNEFQISKITNTSYCYEPGHKLEKVQTVCVYEQSVAGQFTEPSVVAEFIEEQTDLVGVRESNAKNLYLVSDDGRNCNYEYLNENQIIFSCMGNTDFHHYSPN